MNSPDRQGRAFWVGLAVGGAVMAFGIAGALGDAAATEPRALVAWVVAADIVHDALVAPAGIALGWAVGRVVRAPWRAPVRAGLFLSALVAILAWPGLRGYGRATQPDNPSVQPLDYRAGALATLSIVWVAVGVWGAVRSRKMRSVTNP